VRIEETLMKKIRILSNYENRSINKQIVFILKQYILEYENQNDTIKTLENK
ncbi:MAG: hypothetical protein J6C76_05415, partial [Oscillospiraceae bacterium]|nr:hypothetical protein [Oscillospiraceae bacterium]MBP1571319.1 hypothetical protein [Oscillospiraceae bacterium]